MKNWNVLSLEDDENLAVVMRHYLEEENIKLTQVSNGGDFLSVLQKNTFDIILMDLGLPDVDGLTLIPQIKQYHNGPVIVISGKTSTTDRIVGLEMGADDYMTKPFEMRELVARIKANIRRQPAYNGNKDQPQDDEAQIYRFGEWIYDASKLSLKNENGSIVELTSGECEMLHLFLKSKGRALSREYLFEQTRGDNFDSYDRSFDIQVTRLRKKLNDNPSHPTLIKTVRGVGYMFIADVETDRN